jgi:short-subunit dehydrogenase
MSEDLAMVTGASSGIGEAFTRELVKRGFPVIAVARRVDRLASLRGELGSQVDVLGADLATEEGVATVSRRLQVGGITILVNNAGIGYRGLVADQPDASIQQLVRLNLETPMRLARAALGPMSARRHGILINVASMGAFQPVPYLNVYAATKAGLLSFSEALADELEGSGVRVQALCPGNIPTGFQDVAGTKGSRLDQTPSMSATQVARSSLDAALGGRGTVHIPGTLDRVSVFAQRFLPRFVARRVAGSLLKSD